MVCVGIGGHCAGGGPVPLHVPHGLDSVLHAHLIEPIEKLLSLLQVLAPKLGQPFALAHSVKVVPLRTKLDQVLALEELLSHVDLVNVGWHMLQLQMHDVHIALFAKA